MVEEKFNYQKINENRTSGVLLHISSLPGPYGIGSLGENARKFIDFLVDTGQSYWQMLPVGPTSYGDSPYQSFSTFAGNPYFIDLDYLKNDGLLTQEELNPLNENIDNSRVDYGRIYHERNHILRKAFERFDVESIDFSSFAKMESFWLNDYAKFMALKDLHNGASWTNWSEEYKIRDDEAMKKFEDEHWNEITFYMFTQYIFYKQWDALKDYAHEKNIELIGDIPIYVAGDSADIWANPKNFKLDENLELKYVGGVPPDEFSDVGQLWGNPVYDWQNNKDDGYRWWIERIRSSFKLFDVIRIDHFRGFEAYWEIPYGSETAASGKWVEGPKYDLFKAIKEELGELPIIAEDLGFMTKGVYDLRKQTEFPGMKIIQFAFNEEMNSEHMPHNYSTDFIVYAGTHDNETLQGWINNQIEANSEVIQRAIEYGNLTHEEGYNWGIIRLCMNSVADTAIFQLQDILGLGNDARMNTPNSLGINWQWRATEFPNDDIREKLIKYTKNSARLNKNNFKKLKENIE